LDGFVRKLVIIMLFLAWASLGIAYIHVESMMVPFFRLTPGTLGRLARQENCATVATRKNSHGHAYDCEEIGDRHAFFGLG
jgi:hypothetical protein